MKKLVLGLLSISVLAGCSRVQNINTNFPTPENITVQNSSPTGTLPEYILNRIFPETVNNKNFKQTTSDKIKDLIPVKGMKWEYSLEITAKSGIKVKDKVKMEITEINGEVVKGKINTKSGERKIIADKEHFGWSTIQSLIEITDEKFSINPFALSGCVGSPDTHLDCGFVFDVKVPSGSYKAQKINVSDKISVVGDPTSGGPVDIITRDPFITATVFSTQESGLVKIQGESEAKNGAIVNKFNFELLKFKK